MPKQWEYRDEAHNSSIEAMTQANRLGRHGWELVGVTSGTEPDGQARREVWVFWYKRPIPARSEGEG